MILHLGGAAEAGKLGIIFKVMPQGSTGTPLALSQEARSSVFE